jgi:2-polyprenyl-3-methyl-5-hydroxy-6-metoxy-1,4-benzoquinol methylase
MSEPLRTEQGAYAERLANLESVWWKRVLDVQRPYRWHLKALGLGQVLDLGCGLGRNLINLGGAGAGVGVDHNPDSIATCRSRGLTAYLPDEFTGSAHARPGAFDTLLCAHVVEHMSAREAESLVRAYLPFLRSGGRVVFITPQEAGYASDPTHVEFVDLHALDSLATKLGLTTLRRYSFPFPRATGKVFKYNEFVLIARNP